MSITINYLGHRFVTGPRVVNPTLGFQQFLEATRQLDPDAPPFGAPSTAQSLAATVPISEQSFTRRATNSLVNRLVKNSGPGSGVTYAEMRKALRERFAPTPSASGT
jgi:hypothetical protein